MATGNDYHFGALSQPNPPTKSFSTVGRAGSTSDRLTAAKREQEGYLAEAEVRLENFGSKIIMALRGGGPLSHTGELEQILAEIRERQFILSKIQEALARMNEQEVKEG